MSNQFTDKVIEAVQASPLWNQLNQSAKALYEQHGRKPSEEEYQALRNMIIARVMLEDETVKAVAAEEAYKMYRSH